MASRSWMAALTLAFGLASLCGAGEPGPPSSPPTPPPVKPTTGAGETKSQPADLHAVTVELRIAGLGAQGCEVEIKPAHPACEFQPIRTHVDKAGKAKLSFPDVRTRSADRDCTFAITIKEPGHADRTIRRGMRLAAADSPDRASPQNLTCYLTSPSTIARTLNENKQTTKR